MRPKKESHADSDCVKIIVMDAFGGCALHVHYVVILSYPPTTENIGRISLSKD